MRSTWMIVGMVLAAGCGDSGTGAGGAGGTSTTSNTTGSGSTSSSSGTTSATGSTGTGTTTPAAPVIQSVEPLGGALHVMWMNTTMGCDKVELDRKKDAGAYATAYTLTGSATSQHDTQATAPGTYCYKARCLKGGGKSPDSNEKCGTP